MVTLLCKNTCHKRKRWANILSTTYVILLARIYVNILKNQWGNSSTYFRQITEIKKNSYFIPNFTFQVEMTNDILLSKSKYLFSHIEPYNPPIDQISISFQYNLCHLLLIFAGMPRAGGFPVWSQRLHRCRYLRNRRIRSLQQLSWSIRQFLYQLCKYYLLVHKSFGYYNIKGIRKT